MPSSAIVLAAIVGIPIIVVVLYLIHEDNDASYLAAWDNIRKLGRQFRTR